MAEQGSQDSRNDRRQRSADQAEGHSAVSFRPRVTSSSRVLSRSRGESSDGHQYHCKMTPNISKDQVWKPTEPTHKARAQSRNRNSSVHRHFARGKAPERMPGLTLTKQNCQRISPGTGIIQSGIHREQEPGHRPETSQQDLRVQMKSGRSIRRLQQKYKVQETRKGF